MIVNNSRETKRGVKTHSHNPSSQFVGIITGKEKGRNINQIRKRARGTPKKNETSYMCSEYMIEETIFTFDLNDFFFMLSCIMKNIKKNKFNKN